MKQRQEKTKFLAAIIAVFVCGLIFTAPSSASTVDLYMNISGIDGESTEVTHNKWIELETISWGVSSDGQRGTPSFTDLVWTQTMDKSFPKVFEDLVKGTVRSLIQIDFVTQIANSPQVFFHMAFKETRMTKVELAGTTGALPLVSGAFNFEEVVVEYTEYDSTGRKKGTLSAKWNLNEGGDRMAGVSSLFGMSMVPPLTPVPVPGAVFLFGSGLLGLIGFRSRRSSANSI